MTGACGRSVTAEVSRWRTARTTTAASVPIPSTYAEAVA
ncbi:hypothetical protein VAB18032_15105 [Micromonospora maris AB-18-032]|nr:hypothetical protein VAB18032_15105 [Micromonospora maris AB-18-032]